MRRLLSGVFSSVFSTFLTRLNSISRWSKSSQMSWGYQQVGGAWNPRGAFLWGALGSLLVHGLIVATVVAVFHQMPPKPKVVVPVEAINLVPFKPGPAGGGGGRPSPVTRPDAVATPRTP